MNYVNDIFLGVMFILFPIFSYMLYVSYNKNIDKEEDDLVFGFALFSSIYLVLSKMHLYYPRIGLYMADIIILIAYLRNKPKMAFILSFISIYFFYNFSNIFMIFLLSEYTFYFVLNFVRKKYNLHVGVYLFICITLQFFVFALIQSDHYYDNTVLTYFLALFCTFLVVFLVDRIDSIFHDMTAKVMPRSDLQKRILKCEPNILSKALKNTTVIVIIQKQQRNVILILKRTKRLRMIKSTLLEFHETFQPETAYISQILKLASEYYSGSKFDISE